MIRRPKSPRARCYPWRWGNEEGGFSPCQGTALALPGFMAFSARMVAERSGVAAPTIPAAESALGSHPWVAVSSAQVITIVTPVLELAANLPLGLDTGPFLLHRCTSFYKVGVMDAVSAASRSLPLAKMDVRELSSRQHSICLTAFFPWRTAVASN